MKGLTVAMCLSAVVFAAIFGIERVRHQNTRAALAMLEHEMAAGAAVQADHDKETSQLNEALSKLRAPDDLGLANAKQQIDALKLERDSAKTELKQTAERLPRVPKPVPVELADEVEDAEPEAFYDTPEYKEQLRKRERERIAVTYKALFAKLGLSDEDTETLKSLITNRDLCYHSSSGQDAEVILKKAEDALLEFLGDEGYDSFKQHWKSQSQRRLVNGLGESLAKSEHALTDQQREHLIGIMYETRVAAQQVPMKDVVRHSTDDGVAWAVLDPKEIGERHDVQNDLVMDRVKKENVLSEPQQDALQQYLNSQDSVLDLDPAMILGEDDGQ